MSPTPPSARGSRLVCSGQLKTPPPQDDFPQSLYRVFFPSTVTMAKMSLSSPEFIVHSQTELMLFNKAFILNQEVMDGVCVCVYRKLRATLDEYTTRVGQQAIVLCISPSKPNPVFKVFGAAPLENVVSVIQSAG